MADIPPASAPSSATPSAPAAPAGGVTAVGAVVNSTPDKIQNLERQIQVSGLIAAAPDAGTVTVNTAIGPLTLLLPHLAQAQQDKLLQQLLAMFQGQKPVTVLVEPGNPPAQAFLLLPSNVAGAQGAAPETMPPPNAPVFDAVSIRGAVLAAVVLPQDISLPSLSPPPFSPGLASSTPYDAPSVYSSSGQNAAAHFTPDRGAVFTPPADATLAAGNTASGAEFTPLEQALAKTVAQAAASGALAAAPMAVPEESASLVSAAGNPAEEAAASAFASPPAATTGMPANVLQPGAALNPTVKAVVLPGQIPPPLTPNQFIATVAGKGPGGQLILKAGDATLYVRQSADLPVGTQLVVTAAPTASAPPALLTLPDQPAWPALQETMSALMQINPAMAQAIIASRVPSPGEALPGALLFLLSAMRQGDLTMWLGNDAASALTQAGKADLVAKLAQNLQNATQTTHDGTVGQWRSTAIPFFENPHFRTIHFHVHGDGGRKDGRRGRVRSADARIRFLIDVRMSRLGDLQLDGFVRTKQLDMILRSMEALPPGFERELRQAWIKTLGAVGYAGTIGFQQGRQHWINLQRTAGISGLST